MFGSAFRLKPSIAWHRWLCAIAILVGLLAAEPALADCLPELDGQSGTAGAPFTVICNGTETDQQGDGTNRFVNLSAAGTVGTVRLGGSSQVTVSGIANSIGFAFGCCFIGAGGTGGNNVIIEQNGTVNGIQFGACSLDCSVSDNYISVNGNVGQVGFDAFCCAVRNNTVFVGQTGTINTVRVQDLFPSFISVTGTLIQNHGEITDIRLIDRLSVGGGFSGNKIENWGTIVSITFDQVRGAGNEIINYGGGSISGNVLFNSPAGTVTIQSGSIASGVVTGFGDTKVTLIGPGTDAIALGRFSAMGLLDVAGGTWNATGSGAGFTAASIANGAVLNLNGSIGGPVSIAAGGVLSGDAATGALSVGGTVSPGNSVGVVNVNGGLTFNSGSTYLVDVGSCPGVCADRIVASGPVLINGGSVQVLLPATSLTGRATLSIITGASVSGAFSGAAVSGGPFRALSLSYTPTEVLLNLLFRDLPSMAETPNQLAVARALEAGGPAIGAFDHLLGLASDDAARAAFESLSGAGHPSAFLTMEYVHDLFARFAQDRLTASDAPMSLAGLGEIRFAALDDGVRSDESFGEQSQLRMWGRAFGGFGFVEAAPSVAETDFKSGGIAMGLERSLEESVIGLGVGFAETKGDVGATHQFNIETVQFQAYGGTEVGPIEVLVTAGAGHNSIDSKRTITVGAASDIARAHYDGWTIGASGEASYKLVHGEKWRVSPFIGVDYTRVGQQGFTEMGSSLGNLTVEEGSVDALRAVAGIRIQSSDKGFMRTRLSPALRIAYAREFLAGDAFAAAFASNPTAGFHVEGAEFGKDRLMIGLGAAYRLSRNAQIGVGYDGDLSKDDQAHAATARLKVDF